MARKTGSSADVTGPLIIQAAERLFARHGYAAVSMRKIAAEVGVQAGALYAYTPDKQSLLFDLLKGHMEQLLQAWREDTRDVPSLEKFTRFHIRFNLERPDAIFIAYMELRNLTPENFHIIEGLRREYESILEKILQDGVTSGTFQIADVKITTRALIAMLNGVNIWYSEGGRLSREEVETIHWVMVQHTVGVS